MNSELRLRSPPRGLDKSFSPCRRVTAKSACLDDNAGSSSRLQLRRGRDRSAWREEILFRSATVDRTSQGSVFVAEVSLAHVCLCPGLHRGDSSHPNAQGALLTVQIRYDNGPADVAFLGLFSQRSMDNQCEITITI